MKKKFLKFLSYLVLFLSVSLAVAFFRGGRTDYSDQLIPLPESVILQSDNLKNQVKVYYFWATWCSACKLNLPFIKFSYNMLKEKMIFLSIEEGESKEELEKFLKTNNIGFPVISGNPQLLKKFDVTAFPTTLFLNKKNEIVFSDSGILNPFSFFLRILILQFF